MKEQDLLRTDPHSGVLEAFYSAVCQVSNLKTGFLAVQDYQQLAQLKFMNKLHYRKTLILGKPILEYYCPSGNLAYFQRNVF